MIDDEEDTAKGRFNRIAKKTFERSEKLAKKDRPNKKGKKKGRADEVSEDEIVLNLFDGDEEE